MQDRNGNPLFGKRKEDWVFETYFFNDLTDTYTFGIYVFGKEKNPEKITVAYRNNGARIIKRYKVDGWLQAFAVCEHFLQERNLGGKHGETALL